MMSTISQKEYLKRYLGLGKDPGEKKKKKKKDKGLGNRLKIVDDDFDVSISKEIQEDISAANEDAPQIVAVIDDRPPSLRIDEETKNNLWTPIGDSAEIKPELSLSSNFKLNKINIKKEDRRDLPKATKIKRNISDSKKEKPSSSGNGYRSPPINNRSYGNRSAEQEIDNSPPRKIKEEELSPSVRADEDVSSNCHESPSSRHQNFYKRKIERDISPARKKNRQNVSENDSDNSPPRYSRRNSDSDTSPLRRDRDNSPPRKNRKPVSKVQTDFSPQRKDRRYDNSRQRRDPDLSPVGIIDTKNTTTRKRNESDGKDISPPRGNKNIRRESYHSHSSKVKREPSSNHRNEREQNNITPELSNKSRKSRWGDSSESSNVEPEKCETTLSGKRAGLQDAKGITKELVALREKEDELFRSLPEEMSGANAATVVRGKKPVDIEEDARKKLKEREMKEKYDRWGKGLKQVEDQTQKMADQLHEMSKPLARYADDEDLERYLKNQEREGDPMLAYLRKKKRKKAIECGVPEKPEYMGEFMPNRFGIKPGYRWDGVDRSNGYEQRWFETQNKKRAVQEEAHKWSTEDM